MRMVGCSNSGPNRLNLKVLEEVTIAPLPNARQQAVMSKAISSEQKSFAAIHRNGDASVSKKIVESDVKKNTPQIKHVRCTNGD